MTITTLALARRSLLLAACTLALTACGGGGGGSSGGGTPSPPAPVPAVTLTVTHTVRITTNKGVIDVGLDANHAPTTVANFLKYVNDGFYKDTLFHRVIANFVIQGGGITRTANGLVEKTSTYAPIVLESNTGLRNVRGTIAMARTSIPNSATNQFYINVVDNTSLDYPGADLGGGYAVFGKVTAGLDVVDAIKNVQTGSGDLPVADVIITDVKVLP
jgi:cyclophilin family peptidyl-prolyl cis-trans isomerase